MTDTSEGGRNPPGATGEPSDEAIFRSEAETAQPGILRELVHALRTNKKWWLTPIIVLLALFGILIALAGTGAAPFIYTIF